MQQLINPTEFGIEEKKANELIGNLPQIKAERAILEKQYDEIIKLDIEDVETSKKAKELKGLILKNRTQGINVWHKTTKEFFLKGGQFVDAIKRLEVQVNERMEETLEKIEKHFEIKQALVIEEIKNERLKQLELYIEFVPTLNNLGAMPDDEFQIIFNGAKLQYEAKVQQEKIAEEKRQAEIKLLEEFKHRSDELLPYKFFAESNIEIGMSEDAYLSILENAKNAKAKDDAEKEKQRKENERLKQEAEIREKEHLAKLQAEKLKQQKLEAELKKQAEEKRQAELKEQQKLEAELNKSDSNKVLDLINELNSIKTKYQFKSKSNKEMFISTCTLIDKTINFINNKK
jgi:hypothetical protein